ncbi:MAG: DUF4292 domain-containing protein [Bacteroidota bacterium]
MKKNTPFYILILFMLSIFSCKQSAEISKDAVKDKDPQFLFSKLKENEFKYDWIKAKFDATISTKKSTNSFKGFLRVKRDSIIWLSISPALGIEIARLSVTNDSVKLLNRLESTYFIKHFKYLSKIVDADIDFDMLQAFLTGNDFAYYENDKFKSSIEKDNYKLNTIGRRKLKKAMTDSTSSVLLEEILLNPTTYKISRHHIKDIKENKQFIVTYVEYMDINGQLLPKTLKIEIKAKEDVMLKIEFVKYELDQALDFPFSIPEKYQNAN